MSLDYREQQRALYGAPLADLMGQAMAQLGLNQSQLAQALGLSAPMLSQLKSAQRVKISNPIVVDRLRALLELGARAQYLTAEQIAEAVAIIRADARTVTSTQGTVGQTAIDQLRQLATADELRTAAGRLGDLPGLSRLLLEAADTSLLPSPPQTDAIDRG